jgi:hypothetical protein
VINISRVLKECTAEQAMRLHQPDRDRNFFATGATANWRYGNTQHGPTHSARTRLPFFLESSLHLLRLFCRAHRTSQAAGIVNPRSSFIVDTGG